MVLKFGLFIEKNKKFRKWFEYFFAILRITIEFLKRSGLFLYVLIFYITFSGLLRIFLTIRS